MKGQNDAIGVKDRHLQGMLLGTSVTDKIDSYRNIIVVIILSYVKWKYFIRYVNSVLLL